MLRKSGKVPAEDLNNMLSASAVRPQRHQKVCILGGKRGQPQELRAWQVTARSALPFCLLLSLDTHRLPISLRGYSVPGGRLPMEAEVLFQLRITIQ